MSSTLRQAGPLTGVGDFGVLFAERGARRSGSARETATRASTAAWREPLT